jgi:replicative DNA helicase
MQAQITMTDRIIQSGSMARMKRSVDDSKSLLVDPLEERLQPFYGVDGCGHIADWDNEAALIGCAFLDPVLVMSALENVGLENPVDLFGDKRHRIVFRIAREICNRGGALDLITFASALKTEVNAKREKPGVVAMEYVSDLMEKVPSPSNWSYYLETVLDRYKARRKRQLMQRQYTLENENPNGPGDVNESIDDLLMDF